MAQTFLSVLIARATVSFQPVVRAFCFFIVGRGFNRYIRNGPKRGFSP